MSTLVFREIEVSEQNSPAVAAPSSPNSFNLGRVLGAVLGIMSLGGGGYLISDYLSNRPVSFVKVTGRVTWNGQPVSIGSIMTLPIDHPQQPSIGPLNAEGRFELMTNGTPGAIVGTHKVMVASYGEGAVPLPLVPSDYLKPGTTPLTIEVTEDAAQNHFELQVVGKKPGSNGNDADPSASDTKSETPDSARESKSPMASPPISQ